MAGGAGPRQATGLWARREVRRRWASLVVLGLLAGAAAAVSLSAIAGARRTDTAFERLRTQTHGADAIVFASQVGIETPDWGPVARLPYVQAAGSFGFPFASVAPPARLRHLEEFGLIDAPFGSWRTEVDVPVVLQGRLPDPANPYEVLADEDAADAGIRVGDVLAGRFSTKEQIAQRSFWAPGEGRRFQVRVVGIGRSTYEKALVPIGPAVFATPAFRRVVSPEHPIDNLLVRFEPGQGDVAQLERDARRLLHAPELPVLDARAASKRVTNGTDLETLGLLAFGLAVAAAGLVLVGQALARSVRAGAEDVGVLGALGCTRSEMARGLALPHLVTVAVGTVTGAIGMVALSSRYPIGLGRQIEPDPGLHLDLPVLLAGAAGVAVLLGAIVLATAWRQAGRVSSHAGGRRSALVALLGRWGATPVMSTGARLALEPGGGRRALPTRPALVGAIAGVIGVVGAFTLASGLSDAISHPARVGSVWDLEVSPGSPDTQATFARDARLIQQRPEVVASAHIDRALVLIDGQTLPTYDLIPVEGDLTFVTLHGRAPQRDGEIVLGPDTARHAGLSIGDRVSVGTRHLPMEIVGIGLFPQTPHSGYDQGAWVAASQMDAIAPSTAKAFAPPDQALVLRLRPGTDLDRLAATVGPAAERKGLEISPPEVPQDLSNMRNVRSLPILFGVFTTLLALATLTHVTASVARRRGPELAVLRAIGMTPRQVRWCLSWQASTYAVVGVALGVPLGLVAGRQTWRALAEAAPFVYVPPLALAAVVLAVPGALVLANLLAVVPGRLATRLNPAEQLRAE